MATPRDYTIAANAMITWMNTNVPRYSGMIPTWVDNGIAKAIVDAVDADRKAYPTTPPAEGAKS